MDRTWLINGQVAGGDPNISVDLTENEFGPCIRITLGTNVTLLHTRSAVDLQYKLGLAILDWVAESSYLLALEGFRKMTEDE